MSIIVKVLSAKKEVGSHPVPNGKVLVLQAQHEVNYQLVDTTSGFAPQNILTKREGDNLVILLEDGNMQPDIIIEDYYSHQGNLVIGLHENGRLYAYVPESGIAEESISLLAKEVTAPQAIGGDELVTPFWVFNPWWLAGAGLLIGGAALALSGGKKKSPPPVGEAETDVAATVGQSHVGINGSTKHVVQGTAVKITLTDQNGQSVTVETQVDAAGKYVVPAVDTTSLMDGPVQVTTRFTDSGNRQIEKTSNFILDQHIPGDSDKDGVSDEAGKPVVTFNDGNDGVLQKSDLNPNGQAVAKVTFPANSGYSVGDTVKVTDQNNQVVLERPLTQQDLDNGMTVAVSPAAEGSENRLNVQVTDPQNNRTITATDSATSDLNVPGDVDGNGVSDEQGKPVVAFNSAVPGKITKADLDNEGKASALVTFPKNSGYSVGDVAKIADQDGTVLVERPLTQQDLDNGIVVRVTPAAEDEPNTIQVSVTDPQGNRTEQHATVTTDLVLGELHTEVALDNRAKTLTISGTSKNIVPNSVVDISVVDRLGTEIIVSATVDDEGNYRVENPVDTSGLADGTLTITSTAKDVEGVVVRDRDGDVTLDQRVPGDSDNDGMSDETGKPQIRLTDSNNDEKLNKNDLDENGKLPAMVTFPTDGGYSVGDIAKITDQDGKTLLERPLTQEDLDNGIPLALTPQGEGLPTGINVDVTDPEGNTTSNDAAHTTDLARPGDSDGNSIVDGDDENKGAPVVTILGADDNKIGKTDVDVNGKAKAKIDVPAEQGYRVGDTLVVTLPDDTVLEIPLTETHLTDGVTVEFTPLEDENANNIVKAFVRDPEENQSATGQDEGVTDFHVPGASDQNGQKEVSRAPQVTLNDGNDGELDPADLDEQGKATAKVTFPAESGYSVGDTVEITDHDGNVVLAKRPLTQEDLDNGIEISLTPAAENKPTAVNVKVTDPQNNDVTSQDQAKTDLKVPGQSETDNTATDQNKPQVQLGNGDEKVTVVEDNPFVEEGVKKVPATITFPANSGYSVGDKVTATDQNGNPLLTDHPLTEEELTNGIRVNVPVAEEGQPTTVNVRVDDGSNPPVENSESATVDLKVPGHSDTDGSMNDANKPQVTLINVDDPFVRQGDLVDNKVPAKVTFPVESGYSVGDDIVITDHVGEELYRGTLSAQDLVAGIDVALTPAAEGELTTVNVKVTDPQNNDSTASDSATTDLKVPGASDATGRVEAARKPQVVFQDGDNEKLDPAEVVNAKAPAKVTFPVASGYSVGDMVKITDQDDNVLVERPLTQQDLDNGIDVAVTPAKEGQDTVVNVKVTDPQNNETTASDKTKTDLKRPGDSNGDGVANDQDENDGQPKVEIGNGDDKITRNELNPQGQVTAKIHVPASQGYSEGDILSVSVPGNTVPQEIPLTQEMIEKGYVEVPFTPVDEGKENLVTAVVKDASNNHSKPGSADAQTNLKEPGQSETDGTRGDVNKPQVVLTDGGDEKITKDELNGNSKVPATVTFPANSGYSEGDLVVITDHNGAELLKRPLTQDDLNNGIPLEVTPAAEGEKTAVNVMVTDPQNSSASGRDDSTTDLKVPGASDATGVKSNELNPQVEIQDGGDGKLDPEDIADGKATVTFPANGGYSVGDTVVITDHDGKELLNRPLTEEDLKNGITIDMTPAPENKDTVVTVTVTDGQNNSASGSDTSKTDLKRPGDSNNDNQANGNDNNNGAPIVEMGKNNDGKITRDELNDEGKVTATIKVPAENGYSVGDTLVVSAPGSEFPKEIELTEEHLANGVPVTFTPVGEGSDNLVTAVVRDASGNRSQVGSNTAQTDIKVPGQPENGGVAGDQHKPQIEIGNNDGKVTTADQLVTENGVKKVPAKVTFPTESGYSVGDKVTITDQNGAKLLENHPLTEEELQNGIPLNVPVAEENSPTTVNVSVSDGSNPPVSNSKSENTDIKIPGRSENDGNAGEGNKPVVTILDGNDGKLQAAELTNGKASATITFPAESGYSIGDTIVVKDQSGATLFNGELTATHLTTGLTVTNVTPAAERANTEVTVTVSSGADSVSNSDTSITDLQNPGSGLTRTHIDIAVGLDDADTTKKQVALSSASMKFASGEASEVWFRGNGGVGVYLETGSSVPVGDTDSSVTLGLLTHRNYASTRNPPKELLIKGNVTVSVDGQSHVFKDVALGTLYPLETSNGGSGVTRDDFFVFAPNTDPEALSFKVNGRSYQLSVSRFENEVKQDHDENRRLLTEINSGYRTGQRGLYNEPLSNFLNTAAADSKEVSYIRSPEDAENVFDFNVTVKALGSGSTTIAGAKSELPEDYLGSVPEEAGAAWNAKGDNITGNNGNFTITKGADTLGTFVGEANGRYTFKAAEGLKKLSDDESVTASFSFGGHEVLLDLNAMSKAEYDALSKEKAVDTVYTLLNTSPLEIDFATVGANAEVLDLSARDFVLSNVTSAIVSTHRQGMYIRGGADDTIELGDAWTKGDVAQATSLASPDNLSYVTYTSNGATLYIQDGITVA